MELFANAAYGIVPPDHIQLRLEEAITKYHHDQLSSEEVSWSECVVHARDIPAVQAILQELKMPSASVILVEKTEDGCDLEDGTLIVGWALMTFPDITLDDNFWRAKLEVTTMEWHLWVQT